MARPPVNAPLRDIGPWTPPSPVRVAWLIVLCVLVAGALTAAAGWWAGGAVRTDEAAPVAAGPPVAAIGPMRIEGAPRWTVARDAPEAERLDRAATAVFAVDPASSTRAIFTLAPAADATLLPPGLRATLARTPPAPTRTEVLGRPAWSYAGLETLSGRTMDVSLLPTTSGVLAVACTRGQDQLAGAADCGGGATTIDLGGAQPLAPAADLALRQRLPAAIERLDGRRTSLRRSLRGAQTRRGQARFARRLARAYARTGALLAPVAPRGAGPLRAMHRADLAYRRLGRAALGGRRGSFARARVRVGAAEAALRKQLP
jgi:hypothetical protein